LTEEALHNIAIFCTKRQYYVSFLFVTTTGKTFKAIQHPKFIN